MPAIDITPPAAQPAQLPADLLNQMQRGPDQMMQIIQHGNDQRLGLMSQQLQNAMEISRQREQIKLTTDARVKEQQASLDAQAREHAAMMGMDVKDGDTAVSLAPKFQARNQTMAKTVHNFYSNELGTIRGQEQDLMKRQAEVFKQDVPPVQQKQALIAALNASSDLKPEVKALILDNIKKAGNSNDPKAVQKIVDTAVSTIRGEGDYGLKVRNMYLTHAAADTAAAGFMGAFQQQLMDIGAPLKQQALAGIAAERQEIYKVKQGLMQRYEANGLPVMAAAGEPGMKMAEDFGKEYGGQASTLSLQNKLKDIPGIGPNANPVTAPPGAVTPPVAQPAQPGMVSPPPMPPGDSGVGLPPSQQATPNDISIQGNPGGSIPASASYGKYPIGQDIMSGLGTVAQGIGSMFDKGISMLPQSGAVPTQPSVAPGQTPDATTGQGINNPADAAKVQMAVSLLKHPIGLQAPSDRLLQGTPQEQQAVAAKLAQFDPSGQTAKGLQSMVNGNPQQNQIGIKLINTLLLMQRQNVDPISVIKAQDVRGTPPPGGLGGQQQPSLTP